MGTDGATNGAKEPGENAHQLLVQYADDEEEDKAGYEEDEESEEGLVGGRRRHQQERRRECPYLDTVNRQNLDFDFDKFCSVSLSNLNVYGCLVCGKYFQGRARSTHAYTHSLEQGHHVFINLHTERVYCLPEGYEVLDPSLEDIKSVLNPRFSRLQIQHLDKNKQWARALDGSDYIPGMVGLNNIKDTDFVNVTVQSLMRVTPLRDFFLCPSHYASCSSILVHRFGELTRKVWHPRNFKGQVSPHEFLQAIMVASSKRFRIGQQSDPVEFLSWLLNTLHADLLAGGATLPSASPSPAQHPAIAGSGPEKKSGKKARSSSRTIIHECFQGELEVVKETGKRRAEQGEEDKEGEEEEEKSKKRTRQEGKDGEGGKEEGEEEARPVDRHLTRMPFLMLGLDLPPPPLFKDVMEKNIIPQVPLFNIVKKFDGETVTEVVRPQPARMRYRITRLPRYLILHMKRFKKNNFFVEKNPTLVNFPVKNLELKDFLPLPATSASGSSAVRSKYDLIANIVHEGKPGEGVHRVYVQRKSEESWYELQDLHVAETLPQMVALSEAYIQIYEQQQQQAPAQAPRQQPAAPGT